MDTQFSVFEILEIAEEVERKAACFYLRLAERFPDRERRGLYYDLAAWRTRHQQAWARVRQGYSERTGEFGIFDPDNYVLSNPQVMASLTLFGVSPANQRRPSGCETRAQILQDAVERAKGVIIFYHGLKEFAGGLEARMMIDNMISEEERHVRLLSHSLESTGKAADGRCGCQSPRRAEVKNCPQ